jgi:hypothetical protein
MQFREGGVENYFQNHPQEDEAQVTVTGRLSGFRLEWGAQYPAPERRRPFAGGKGDEVSEEGDIRWKAGGMAQEVPQGDPALSGGQFA